jgi:hypothetical protein
MLHCFSRLFTIFPNRSRQTENGVRHFIGEVTATFTQETAFSQACNGKGLSDLEPCDRAVHSRLAKYKWGRDE